ncbi:hypothetical protein NM688_g7183 [Phlebia brevispora]|uniref:Uncharacterized protein n=1 Tax=Phlebia brevispora TaxID=194682 RepID=A0ACC1S835_9APHY|nr:hypothetical protein NM688_g7183 [Phlebia brevispora]
MKRPRRCQRCPPDSDGQQPFIGKHDCPFVKKKSSISVSIADAQQGIPSALPQGPLSPTSRSTASNVALLASVIQNICPSSLPSSPSPLSPAPSMNVDATIASRSDSDGISAPIGTNMSLTTSVPLDASSSITQDSPPLLDLFTTYLNSSNMDIMAESSTPFDVDLQALLEGLGSSSPVDVEASASSSIPVSAVNPASTIIAPVVFTEPLYTFAAASTMPTSGMQSHDSPHVGSLAGFVPPVGTFTAVPAQGAGTSSSFSDVDVPSTETTAPASESVDDSDSDSDDTDVINTRTQRRNAEDLKYIEDPTKRCKRYSERCSRLMRSLRKLCLATEPYALFFIARPESVLSARGAPKAFISLLLSHAVPDLPAKLEDLLESVKSHRRLSTSDHAAVAALNKSVNDAREALAEETRKRKALEEQLARLQGQSSE